MLILIHTSKTMRSDVLTLPAVSEPQYLAEARELVSYVRTLSVNQLASCMQVSEVLAKKVQTQLLDWQGQGRASAVSSFVGDIYSGLQSAQWDDADIAFAQKHLRIVSGLYGVLRPLDAVEPYRLEMGCRLPHEQYKYLDQFWQTKLVGLIQPSEVVINLTAVEYSKALVLQLPQAKVITPVFLTMSPKTGEPTFVTVHTKIARGAFANWLICNRVSEAAELERFTDLGYSYSTTLSTPQKPTFVCREFGGLGLSVRLAT